MATAAQIHIYLISSAHLNNTTIDLFEGEIRLTTALDGSTLFCCPECQMAYPERGLLEQHLVGHNLERRLNPFQSSGDKKKLLLFIKLLSFHLPGLFVIFAMQH